MSTLELENIKHPDNANTNIALASNGSIIVDRRSTDGTIAEFRKDGTAVGSVGTKSGSVYIGTGDAGIAFNHHGSGNLDSVMPYSITTGAFQNGAVNIGGSVNRFKDLYLSGGVYLGGTGSANHLDDYEEGTWSGRLSSGYTGSVTNFTNGETGFYVKVGNLVHFQIHMTNSPSGGSSGQSIYLTGLPFTCNNYTSVSHWIYDGFNSIPSGNVPILRTQQNAAAVIFQRHTGTGGATLQYSHMSGGMNIMVSGTYNTTA